MQSNPIWRRIIVSALFLVLAPAQLSAGSRVHARITDRDTQLGIARVNVVIVGTDVGTISDPEGWFRLAVEPGQVLRLTHIAYEPLDVPVTQQTVAAPEPLQLALNARLLLGEPVFVTATRAEAGQSPIAFTTLGQRDFASAGVDDVPMALSGVPGVYAFSDAGNGVGYTYLKIRGFDQDRIGVMINGIPLNDPESHQVYWVDHGDILAGSGEVQIQRGIGNSLYGTTSLGGSVNLMTSPRALPPGLTIKGGYGDFTDRGIVSPSRKLAVQWSGQPLAGQALTLYGRYSGIRSDGYRLGSGTRQDAVHLIGERLRPLSSTKLELISGSEVTHFSWDGIIPRFGYGLDDREGRRYNFYADPQFNGGRSQANRDVFRQNILSLQHAMKRDQGLFSVTLYRVSGRGFYDQFKGGRDLREYNLQDVIPLKQPATTVDLMRRKWLVNGYWGVIPQTTLRRSWGTLVVGGSFRSYGATHFGEVRPVDDGHDFSGPVEYYRYATAKTSGSVYVHSVFRLGASLSAVADLGITRHRYQFDQEEIGAYTQPYQYELAYTFIAPKAGLHVVTGRRTAVYVNLARAQREPADSDIYDADDPGAVPALAGAPAVRKDLDIPLVQAEELWDLELGWTYRSPGLRVTTGLYSMWFQNELIPLSYRTITDDGVPIHGNADLTLHRGLEVAFSQQLTDQLALDGSLTVADNRFVDYTTFEWQVDSSVNHGGNQIPGHPQSMGRLRLNWTVDWLELWGEARYTGRIFIDRQNTAEAAIDPSRVLNIGLVLRPARLLGLRPSAATLSFKVTNALDALYETFGYNYWDWDDGPYRVDVYWPAATRSYFVELALRL